MSLCADIKAILLETPALIVVAPTAGFTWFERTLPDTPADVTSFYEYEGPPPARTMDIRTAIIHPRFQIIARGEPNSDDVAEARASAIHNRLDGIVDRTIGSVRYIAINAVGSVGFLKRDPLGRASFACSYEARRTP